MSLLFLLVVILTFSSWTKASLEYNSTLNIPNPIPENTFVIDTLYDRNTVDYIEDFDVGGSAKGQCKNYIQNTNSLAGPCLIIIDDDDKEGFLKARCHSQNNQNSLTGDEVRIHIYFDDTRGKTFAGMSVTSSNKIPQAWYGFGNESSESTLHSEKKTFYEPDSTILINCLNNKRGPIAS